MMLLDALFWILANRPAFTNAFMIHLMLSGTALGLAILIAVPVGIVVSRYPRAAAAAINGAGIARTVPSLAILAIMLPLVGTGFAPSVIALIVLALPPILINTYVGIREVDPDVVDSARGMGMTTGQIVGRIEVPLAAPVIFAGIRTSAVQVVAGATLASFIGGGGLGDFITTGVAIMDPSRMLVGAVPVALLAIATEILFGLAERLVRRSASTVTWETPGGI